MEQYIFIDIDGTLLNEVGSVPESAIEAISKAQDNGHKVFINTGRAKSGMPAHVADLSFDGFVYSAGTVVEINNEQIFFDMMMGEDVVSLSSLLDEMGIGFSLEGYNRSFFDDISGKIFDSFNFMNAKPDKLLHFREYDSVMDSINKMCLFSKKATVFNALNELLPEHLKLIIHDKSYQGIYMAEIIKTTSSKATGIEKVLEHYGAGQEQTICFGDSPNDYDMVEFCRLGVCMEDGSDELKAIADDFAKPAGEDGIYHYFDKIGLLGPVESNIRS